jgi:steroid delta-isomerase-like uncharacterized protein
MSLESTSRILEQYWDSNHTDVSMMADDVVFTMMANGDETKTPQGVLQMLNYFYHIAFDATATTENKIVGDGHGMVEGHVVGKHIGEFAGIPATGRDIRVPICVSYDVENDQIKRARIYFEFPVLMQQLGVTGASTPATG